MLFSSITFLYYFLPISLAVYFLVPARNGSMRVRNLVLLVFSIVLYLWGEPVYILLMAGQTVSGFVFGLLIEQGRVRGSRRLMKGALFAAVSVSILCLGFFKYSDFFILNWNELFGTAVPLLRLALPIGISFYTFQILSYVIDLYDGRVKLQRSLPFFAVYVMLFPQLVAGPIVRYAQVEQTLVSRSHTWENFRYGAVRFVLGLAKKVLLANTLGELVAIYKACESDVGAVSTLYVWLYAVAYALHIYYDFSGYSDMAIGIGRMFGFHFPENFNYPYIAGSVSDFWRRWHMTLSSWFRDYVYIRLGGNRVSRLRHLFNICFVWLLTGFWHGAGWNFILWGLYYAALLLLEKYVLSRFGGGGAQGGGSLRSVVRHLYVMLALLVGWVLFDADTLAQAAGRLHLMLGGGAGAMAETGAVSVANAEALYYLRDYLVPLIVAAICATPLPARAARRVIASPIKYCVLLGKQLGVMQGAKRSNTGGLATRPYPDLRGKSMEGPVQGCFAAERQDEHQENTVFNWWSNRKTVRYAAVLEAALVLILLLASTACLVDGSFNPFIYFRF